MQLNGGVYGGNQLTVFPRFQNEIYRPFLYGPDCQFYVAVCGNHNDGMIAVVLQNTLQPIQAFVPRVNAGREVHVQQDGIEMLRFQ
ncbi:hypothetical protein SDC9_66739 [bioreactor metagenome]|uniref:Uncharacterized protein n=1 Tax=bioreactor metagenome TaxID=1076179 RepID=A0A644XVS7_9ZZZZ